MQNIATAPELAQDEERLGAFVEEMMPELAQRLRERLAAGADIADLIGMVTDGSLPALAAERCAAVVPRSQLRGMSSKVRDLGEPETFADLLERPRAGVFLIFVAGLEGRCGFVAYGYNPGTGPLFQLRDRLYFGGAAARAEA